MGQIEIRLTQAIQHLAQHTQQPITAAEVAERAGVDHATLQAIENNQIDQISLATIARLCDVLGCPLGELVVYTADHPADSEDAIESRNIVDRWHRHYGADEHPNH